MAITADQVSKTIEAQGEVNVKNIADTQAMNAENLEETLRIQREESQRAQKLQTETNFINTHAINQQAEVLKTAAENLGAMSQTGGGDGSGLNPAGLMTGMALGGAMGNQMAGMMNQMAGTVNQPQNTPPPLPVDGFYLVLNGQQAGPFNMSELIQLASNNQFNKETLVWKEGMSTWEKAENKAELATIFNQVPPPIPPNP
jgi:hypothetical protein